MDGAPSAETLERKALPVDPGRHAFAFAAAGRPVLTRTLVLTQGGQGRREVIVGGVLVAGGVALFSTRGNADRHADGHATERLVVARCIGPGQGGLAVRGAL